VQSDLYDSIRQCCSTPSGKAAFSKYTTTTGVSDVIAAAPVNVSAVLETGSYPAAAPAVPVAKMTGRLLNSAGVKNCKVRLRAASCLYGARCSSEHF
jgi:hypothetical protein